MTTTPIAHGYPDWGRQVAQSDILVYSLDDAAFTDFEVSARLFAGNTPWLYVNIETAANISVDILFFTEQTGGLDLSSEVIVTGDIGVARACIPMRGAYVQIVTAIDAADEPEAVLVNVFAIAEPYNTYAFTEGANVLIEAANQAQAAGTNVYYTPNIVVAGRARWVADFVGATTFTIYLKCIAFDGTERILDYVRANNRATDRQVYLPPLPVYIHAFNQDGVSRDILATVTYDPYVR